METFKIFKFKEPSSLNSLYKHSTRALSMTLITPVPSIHFLYKSSVIWNKIVSKLSLPQFDMSSSLSQIKSNLKKALLHNQHQHDEVEWQPSHDFNIDMIKITAD